MLTGCDDLIVWRFEHLISVLLHNILVTQTYQLSAKELVHSPCRHGGIAE